jgi:hypothetical protein
MSRPAIKGFSRPLSTPEFTIEKATRLTVEMQDVLSLNPITTTQW